MSLDFGPVHAAHGGAQQARSDRGCSLAIARRFSHRAPSLAVWVVPLLVLALSLALPGTSWATLPPDESSLRSPRAAQTVTWTDFMPVDWVTVVPFTSSVTASSPAGLEPLGDAYSASTDGGATWSSWSTSGLSTGIPVSTTHDISVTGLTFPDSATQNLIRFRTVETGGVEAVSANYTVRVDATPPAAPQGLTADPSTWTNLGSFSVYWTNPPDVSPIAGAWYKLGSAPTSSTDGTYVVTTNSIAGITPSADGAHPIHVWLQDTFGRANHNNASSTTLYWDTTPPEPPTRLSGSPARQWTNVNNFSESWRNPEDLSGITGAYYKLNALPNSATDGAYVKTVNTISNIQTPRDGRHDIYVWLVDAAGNVDEAALTGDPDVFWYDGTLPASTAALTPPLPATGWYTSSVNIRFAATDLPEDLDYPPLVYTQLNGGVWTAVSELNLTTEGSQRLLYQARDKAGNLEPAKEILFGIDMTPPVVSLIADRLPNASGWYTAAVTYTLTVADSVSGSPKGFYRLNDGPWQTGTIFALAADGAYRIEYYGQDAAGNRSTLATTEASVDATPPVTGQEIDGTPGEPGWHVSNVTVRLLPVDNGSGVVSTSYRIDGGAWQTGLQFPLAGDGIYDVSYTSTDTAGNTESPVLQQVKIDTVAPGAPTDLQAVPTGWSRTNAFTVQWVNLSDLSGVAGAYYKFGDAPVDPRDGAYISQTNRIESLAVPAEGAYRLYLWLRDGAGNADHTTASAAGPILRYDATAPTTSVQVQGQEGSNGWYRSPVTVTLSATDSASGIAALHYRVNGGEWQATTKTSATLTLSQADKHLIEYYAEDVAGNLEAVQGYTVRLDFTASPAPSRVRVLPVGWTGYNSFHLEWPLVTDQSGIGGAYVRFGSPPSGPTDGTFYVGVTEVNGVQAPTEGRHTVYVWLVDGAGNADHTTAVAISDAVWYDGSRPVTVITSTAASGLNGWFVEPVTFVMSATDAASGVREIRHQVDGGAWVPGETFTVGEDGLHTIRIGAVDYAGNEETAHGYELAIDRTPPQAAFTGPSSYQSRTRFEVTWSGADGARGSGLASYTVQVRDGYDGAWQEWLQETQLTAAQFDGQRGHTYFFRVMARDRAGNRQPAGGTWRVLVEPILNGGFDTGAFSDWTASGSLYMAVVPTAGPGGPSVLAARLGTEDYGPSLQVPGSVPVGSAMISQTMSIPELSQVRQPCLHFWYRVQTYDVMYSQRLARYVDTFDVTLNTIDGQEIALLLRDGNPTSQWGSLYDTGWKAANIDLKPYAGRTVQLNFANWNRNDNLLNTWSFVDDIQIRECTRTFMPLILGSGVDAAAATDGAAQPAEAPARDSDDRIR